MHIGMFSRLSRSSPASESRAARLTSVHRCSQFFSIFNSQFITKIVFQLQQVPPQSTLFPCTHGYLNPVGSATSEAISFLPALLTSLLRSPQTQGFLEVFSLYNRLALADFSRSFHYLLDECTSFRAWQKFFSTLILSQY